MARHAPCGRGHPLYVFPCFANSCETAKGDGNGRIAFLPVAHVQNMTKRPRLQTCPILSTSTLGDEGTLDEWHSQGTYAVIARLSVNAPKVLCTAAKRAHTRTRFRKLLLRSTTENFCSLFQTAPTISARGSKRRRNASTQHRGRFWTRRTQARTHARTLTCMLHIANAHQRLMLTLTAFTLARQSKAACH